MEYRNLFETSFQGGENFRNSKFNHSSDLNHNL